MNRYIKCSIENNTAMVTIDRPEALNALNQEVLKELYDLMTCLNDDLNVKAVIVTGSGNKAFVAGADIAAMKELDVNEAVEFAECGHRTMNYISGMRPVVIAAVNGFALGGGCELAMACDIRVAADNACFGIPETKLGVIPGFGGTQRLPRLVGLGKAIEMLATGRNVKADEAKNIGLVNEVVSKDELLEYCKKMADTISKNSSSAIRIGKNAMTAGLEMDLDKGLKMEIQSFGITFSGNDQTEGMKAFIEKRPALFK